MDPMVVQYLGFIVAALILIWAVIEVNKRLYRRNQPDLKSLNNWVELDTKRPEAREEPPGADHAENNEDEIELHMRSRQNGHHAESQRPPL